MASPVLVTGAAGFAGSHLLELLAKDPGELFAWRRTRAGPPPIQSRATWAAVDLLDRDAVGRAIEELRPAVVYHCAGAPHVGRAWSSSASTLKTNALCTHNLLEALRRTRVSATVLIPSSALVYRPSDVPLKEDDPLVPAGPYGVSKLAQEMLGWRAAADGLDVRIARPFNHIGPRQSPEFAASGFARRIADIERGNGQDREIAVGNLDAHREAIDVRDATRAYKVIVERGRTGRPYNVCSGRTMAIRELLERLLSRARVPITVRVDAGRLRPNDIPLLAGDPSRARDELGWQAEIPLDRTLDDLLDYWRQQAPFGHERAPH